MPMTNPTPIPERTPSAEEAWTPDQHLRPDFTPDELIERFGHLHKSAGDDAGLREATGPWFAIALAHEVRNVWRARLSALEADARRYQALRQFLTVTETEGGESWGLWCLPPSQRDNEGIAALYHRGPLTAAEEAAAMEGESEWGPDVDAMVDELTARAAEGGREP